MVRIPDKRQMGTAFSRGELAETMDQFEGDGTTTSVAVDEVAEHEAPSGMALHTSPLPQPKTAVCYRIGHFVVVVGADGTSQLFNLHQLKMDVIESV